MKKSIFVFILAFVSISLSAQDPVKFGNYWYTISTWNNSATLVANPNNESYSGDVVIPDVITIDNVDYKVTSIGERAFCGCNILTVTIGNNVTYIGYRAFAYSTVASAIIGGEYDKNIGGAEIGNWAFYGCPNLSSVVIGDNIFYVQRGAFQDCPSLSSVVIGKHVSWLGSSAITGCNKLKDVYCYGETSPYQNGGRIFADDKLSSYTLHVPEAFYDKYVVKDPDNYPWSHFGTTDKLKTAELVKCATPEISYANGTISFTCATEGVKYNSSVEYVENEFNDVSEYPAPSNFRVKVVAVKNGCLPSDVAEQEFTLPGYVDVKTGEYKQGDVNKDGNVNVADHVKLSGILLGNK